MNLQIFATTHNLMEDINMIDSLQVSPCNMLQTSNSFARSDTVVVVVSEPHLICTCKTSILFAPSH